MVRNNQGNRGNNGSRNSNRSSERYGAVGELTRERPLTAAIGAAAAVGAGVFLWSRRNQISDQISNLSDQIGEWTSGMGSSGSTSGFDTSDDTAGLATGSSSTSRENRGDLSSSTSSLGMSETGGGNASLGASSGGGGMGTAASGRGRARQSPTG